MNTELYVEILSWHILNSNSRSAIVQGRRREGGREGEARASRGLEEATRGRSSTSGRTSGRGLLWAAGNRSIPTWGEPGLSW